MIFSELRGGIVLPISFEGICFGSTQYEAVFGAVIQRNCGEIGETQGT